MSELLVRPLNSYDYNDGIEQIGAEIHVAVRGTITELMLEDRHLPGVIERYGRNEHAAVDSITHAWRESRRGIGFTAFLGFDSESDAFVGMGTMMDDLALYKQRMPLPPKFSRPLLSKKVKYEIGGRSNVAAWVVNNAYDTTNTPLASFYEYLHDVSNGRAWTLNPQGNDYTQTTHRDLTDAGFAPIGNLARYDDQVSSRIIPPKSQLYIAI
jgi:hypothetical protein